MDSTVLEKHFAAIGARVRLRALVGPRWRKIAPDEYTIDIARDRKGPFFDIARASDAAPDLTVLNIDRDDRHLVLYATDGSRFLCGHDEREWFVAALSERVTTVRQAKLSLMPLALRERAGRLHPRKTAKRRNELFVRQGEWFFRPVRKQVPTAAILKNEPLQRNTASKPHMCELLYREGGTTMYRIAGRGGWLDGQDLALLRQAGRGLMILETRVANPRVFVRGHVRHPDHATIFLNPWHRVYLNGEFFASEQVVFLD